MWTDYVPILSYINGTKRLFIWLVSIRIYNNNRWYIDVTNNTIIESRVFALLEGGWAQVNMHQMDSMVKIVRLYKCCHFSTNVGTKSDLALLNKI